MGSKLSNDYYDSALLGDCKELLIRWGSWARNNNEQLGYPNMTPFRRLLGGSVSVAGMCDDEAEEISKKVAELKSEDSQAYLVIDLYYHQNHSLSSLTRELKLNTIWQTRKLKDHADNLMCWKIFGQG